MDLTPTCNACDSIIDAHNQPTTKRGRVCGYCLHCEAE